MTARLYVKRGGAASAETEVMLAAADRKGSPAFDGQTPKVNLGMRYADGESSQGTYVLTDPLAEIPSDTYRIPPHGLVTLTEDASGDELWLARVRNSQISAGRRGVSVPQNEVEWEVTTVDCNIDLTGNHFVHPWERPAETDIDRIIALQAHILNGDSSTAAHHRKSTVITAATVGDGHLLQDGTTHTDDSLTNLAAKTYPPGTVARDVLEDISEAAGKTYGVVIHHTGGSSHLCLLYVQELDHETYDSAIKISQNIADWSPDDPDTPVFEPWWDRGPGKQIENDHVISGLIDIYGGTADNPLTVFVDQSADDETPHEYWTDAYFDSDSKTEAQATFRANQILASRRPPGHTTHQLSIKMHPEQTRLLTAGMSVSVKSAVVTGAPLSYVKRRVSELRWELAPDGDWFAHLDLDRPIRVRRGSLQSPQAPSPGTDGTPPTGGTTDLSLHWDWETDNKDSTGTYSFLDRSTNSNLVRQGSGVGWCAPRLNKSTSRIPCAAGKTVQLSFRTAAQTATEKQTRTFHLRYFVSGAVNNFAEEVITVPPSSGGGGPVQSMDLSYVAPTGTDEITLHVYNGVWMDPLDITIGTPGTPAVDPTPSPDLPAGYVVGPGEGFFGDSSVFIPVGSALEHQYIDTTEPMHNAGSITIEDAGDYYTGTEVETALQEIGADLASVSGGTAELHSHPEYDLTASDLTSAPEGGWSIQSKGNIVQYGGYTYIGYVKGTNGDCRVAVVDNTAPDTVANTVTLHSALNADDHSPPALLVRSSDGKLVAAYCAHDGTALYIKISTNSLDSDPTLSGGFAAETNIDGSLGDSSYSYTQLLELTAESKIYLFYRQGNNTASDWKFSTSSDNGATWAAATSFLDTGTTGPYMKVVRNGTDRFDFVAINDEPNTTTPNVYHFYYDGSWRASDGTAGTLPLGTSEMTQVYDGGSVSQRPMDIAIDVQGNPRVLWASFDTDCVIRYGRWDGSAWTLSEVVRTTTIPGKATNQRHGTLDQSNGLVVWQIVENDAGYGDLYRFTTPDGGDTWERDLIHVGATSSVGDHVPQTVDNAAPEIQVVFLTGTFTDFDDYSLGMKTAGLTTGADADQMVKVSSNDTTAGYLNGKLVAGTGISLTENNDGSNETLTVAATGAVDEAMIRDLGHWEVIVDGSAPPVAVTNEAEDDWLYGWVSG